ncbi:MAG: ShlB/FhaC/HecB family hemolysin secretion/activation protein [Phycisphaerales bacterium]
MIAPALAQNQTQADATSQVQSQELQPGSPELDGEQRPLTSLELVYSRENDSLPPTAELMDAKVDLAIVNDAWCAPHEGLIAQRVSLAELGKNGPTRVYDSALPLISQAIVTRLKTFGPNTRLLGVYAEPDPAHIRVENEQVVDARPEGVTSLRYIITTGRVVEVRTTAVGERINPEQTLNNPVHDAIRKNSPIQPQTATGQYGKTNAIDLLETTRIDDYVFRLNRHPGRRVDVAVAATGQEPGAVSLDYIVTENKPWFVYAEATRDGSRSTDEWRYRLGMVHNQLTGQDDILSLQYQTSFNNVNQFAASYERPLFDIDRLRGRVYGSFYDYTSDDVGQLGLTFKGDGWSAGAEGIFNFYQNADLFADVFAGLRMDHVKVDNQLAAISGDDNFILAYAGTKIERRRDDSNLDASLAFEYPLDGASDEAQNNLGRFDADERWMLLKGEANYQFFLEPVLGGPRREDPTLAHELALTLRGQATFGDRLVPNYQEVLGGLYSVRGYPQGIAAGDDAIAASLEYRAHVARMLDFNATPGSLFGEPFRWRAQYAGGPTDWDLLLRGFVDAGRTINVDRQSFEEDQTLVGAGFGAELSFNRRFVVRTDLGWALVGLDDAGGATIVEEGDFQWHFVATFIY